MIYDENAWHRDGESWHSESDMRWAERVALGIFIALAAILLGAGALFL